MRSPAECPSFTIGLARHCCCTFHVLVVAVKGHFLWESVCPTTKGGVQNGSSIGICAYCIHVCARLALICMLSRCLLTKFLHWSSVTSLLRSRCWLGDLATKGEVSSEKEKNLSAFIPSFTCKSSHFPSLSSLFPPPFLCSVFSSTNI